MGDYPKERLEDRWCGGLWCVQITPEIPEQWLLYANEEMAEEETERGTKLGGLKEHWVGYVRIRSGVARADTRLLGTWSRNRGSEIEPSLIRIEGSNELGIGEGYFENEGVRKAWLEESARRLCRWWGHHTQEKQGGPLLWGGRPPGSDPGAKQVLSGEPMWRALEAIGREARNKEWGALGVQGSMARGDEAPWSDINLAISEPGSDWPKVQDAIAYLVEIETGRRCTIRDITRTDEKTVWLTGGRGQAAPEGKDKDRREPLAKRTIEAHLRVLETRLSWAERLHGQPVEKQRWPMEDAARIVKQIPAGARARHPDIPWKKLLDAQVEEAGPAMRTLKAVRDALDGEAGYWQAAGPTRVQKDPWGALEKVLKDQGRKPAQEGAEA